MATRNYTLWLKKGADVVMHDGKSVRVWPFTDRSSKATLFPGPLLISSEGDTVYVVFKNFMSEHTFHFHGIDADQANDGVPETWPPRSDYTFLTDYAGTYWYHCHANTVLHQEMGMYGAFVVMPGDGSSRAWTGGPPFTKQYVWILDEFDSQWHSSKYNPNFASFNADYFLINGKDGFNPITASNTAITCSAGNTIMLRLIHAGYLIARVRLDSRLPFSVIASDGRPLLVAQTPPFVEIASGERYDLLFTPTTRGTYTALVQYLNWYEGTVRGTARTTITVT